MKLVQLVLLACLALVSATACGGGDKCSFCDSDKECDGNLSCSYYEDGLTRCSDGGDCKKFPGW